MQAFLQQNRDAIAQLCRHYHVQQLAVFGSAARNDFNAASSDVDLLVEFSAQRSFNRFETYFRLHEALEALLLRRVDLVEAGSISNHYLQRAIRGEAHALYAA